MHSWKVVVAGEGGQGVQALAESLALAAFRGGFEALYIPNFGIEQRGGVSLAMVQISPKAIGAPKFLLADLGVALSARSISRTRQYRGANTIFIYDSSLVKAPEISDEVVGLQAYDTIAPEAFAERTAYHEEGPVKELRIARSIAIPAADMARRELHPRVFNMIILGAIVAVVKMVTLEQVKEALAEKLERRFKADPQLRELNFRALQLGYEQVAGPVHTAV
ncbi:MAG TPA: 2-oxoacid:acceptor oxidoreductase family protein [Bacillota bacterium]|nr:2-oxoacid:acceptor oxidoreductase family protein [Bacillota bacterium]